MSTASTSSQPFTLVWILTSFTSTSPARLTSKASPQTVVSVPDHAAVTPPDGSINSTVVTNGALTVSSLWTSPIRPPGSSPATTREPGLTTLEPKPACCLHSSTLPGVLRLLPTLTNRHFHVHTR